MRQQALLAFISHRSRSFNTKIALAQAIFVLPWKCWKWLSLSWACKYVLFQVHETQDLSFFHPLPEFKCNAAVFPSALWISALICQERYPWKEIFQENVGECLRGSVTFPTGWRHLKVHGLNQRRLVSYLFIVCVSLVSLAPSPTGPQGTSGPFNVASRLFVQMR